MKKKITCIFVGKELEEKSLQKAACMTHSSGKLNGVQTGNLAPCFTGVTN